MAARVAPSLVAQSPLFACTACSVLNSWELPPTLRTYVNVFRLDLVTIYSDHFSCAKPVAPISWLTLWYHCIQKSSRRICVRKILLAHDTTCKFKVYNQSYFSRKFSLLSDFQIAYSDVYLSRDILLVVRLLCYSQQPLYQVSTTSTVQAKGKLPIECHTEAYILEMSHFCRS